MARMARAGWWRGKGAAAETRTRATGLAALALQSPLLPTNTAPPEAARGGGGMCSRPSSVLPCLRPMCRALKKGVKRRTAP